jgi:class 3 adenylate cyclase/pimeloyl-ACP methyl ester carboxylesterase
MSAVPEVKFIESGDVDIAYQVVGEGPRSIVLMMGWVSHLEVLWELAEVAQFINRLAAMGRVVLFDKRGTGLSDRPSDVDSADMVPDVLAVMDAAGVDRAVLVGWVDAAAVALLVAASHPERVEALVLGEPIATPSADNEHPWEFDPNANAIIAEAVESSWGQGILLPLIAPSQSGDERIAGWFRKMERMAASPRMAAGLMKRFLSTDLRQVLPAVTAPALLVHRRDAPLIPSEAIQWLADELPRGRYVEVPGDETPGYLGDVDSLMDEVEEFISGTRVGGYVHRPVLTVLFSDVVGSTELAGSVGDQKWHGLLETYQARVRQVLGQYGGREINTAGDGFFITFDSPTLAVRCARSMVSTSREIGIELRIGIHTGEVVVEADTVSGMTVHVGARVQAAADPGEILVSRTVRDIVLGSAVDLEPKGVTDLKGVPGEWDLYRLVG